MMPRRTSRFIIPAFAATLFTLIASFLYCPVAYCQVVGTFSTSIIISSGGPGPFVFEEGPAPGDITWMLILPGGTNLIAPPITGINFYYGCALPDGDGSAAASSATTFTGTVTGTPGSVVNVTFTCFYTVTLSAAALSPQTANAFIGADSFTASDSAPGGGGVVISPPHGPTMIPSLPLVEMVTIPPSGVAKVTFENLFLTDCMILTDGPLVDRRPPSASAFMYITGMTHSP